MKICLVPSVLQVSIVAGSVCRYIFWPRQSLEYLLVQEPYLANVLNIVLGRDITNKLYALNERVCQHLYACAGVPAYVNMCVCVTERESMWEREKDLGRCLYLFTCLRFLFTCLPVLSPQLESKEAD